MLKGDQLIMSNKKLSDEDKKLFRDSMKSVKPLNIHGHVSREDQIKPEASIKNVTSEAMPETPFYLSNYYTQVVASETILEYHISGLLKKHLHEFQTGHLHWQGRLDLHGKTVSEAQDAVCQFIHQQDQLGHRCILIIHGKGSSTGEPPILKNHVNHWLKQFPNVLAFHSAQPRDGGAGAVYVLLKKHHHSSF